MSGPLHPAPAPSPAWRSRRAWITLLAVLVLALAADLGSKHLAFAHVAGAPVTVERARVLALSEVDPRLIGRLIPPHPPVVVVPGVLNFTLVLNPGAVFGMGPGQRWFFKSFTLLALVFAGYVFFAWTTSRDRWGQASIGLLIAGGLGNLYDRAVYACVRDFIHPLPGAEWPWGLRPTGSREIWPYVSNVADLWLIVGIALLAWRLWRAGPLPASPESPAPGTPPAPLTPPTPGAAPLGEPLPARDSTPANPG